MSNAQWQARKEKVFARGLASMAPVFVEKAKNAELWDLDGKRYIDFAAGIAVVNTGHLHPKVQAAVAAQIEQFSHTCLTVTPYTQAVELAEGLVARAPFAGPAKVTFGNSGAEAVENAIKIARAHTGRPGIIAFNGGFHGRTNLTMGLTGKVNPYKVGFGPFPSEIYHLPYPNDYLGVSEECALTALDELFHCDIEASRVAAIIIEPIQGEGGFYPAPASFLKALRAICDQHGIVFICDEIQSGFARTGTFFAVEKSGVEPDIITLAKGLGGGFPISAVLGRAEIMDAAIPGGLGGTYVASPIGCAAGLAVLKVIEEEQLCQKASQLGDTIQGRLKALQARFPALIGQVRGVGAMVAMELIEGGDQAKANPALTKALVQQGIEAGILLLSCGVRGNVIRLLPALTMEPAILDEGLGKLEALFAKLAG
ncbi:4-aminobutyrate--2-oxoglutarate transaminase [Pseudaeromonas paramecii]|uniref:4-aminobutyrate--2-oxoglutarate transaminase n=1 Tax=Pseudaeromonas paramecii TaxID=2138166 RepID=A0ABP8Q0B3_9GAMM